MPRGIYDSAADIGEGGVMGDHDELADALGSFHVAIAEMRRRHLAGEPIPATGYFASPRLPLRNADEIAEGLRELGYKVPK